MAAKPLVMPSVYDQLVIHPDPDAIIAQLSEIAGSIETLSGAPVADSVAYRAANLIDGTPEMYKSAAETLTIGLSAAQ